MERMKEKNKPCKSPNRLMSEFRENLGKLWGPGLRKIITEYYGKSGIEEPKKGE